MFSGSYMNHWADYWLTVDIHLVTIYYLSCRLHIII